MGRLRWWLLAGLVLALLLSPYLWRGPSVADGSWLVVDLGGEYQEVSGSPLGRLFGRGGRTLAGQLSELGKAERDGRLAGVLLRIRALDVGWAKAQDLRQAIQRLAGKGKHTVAYVELEKYGPSLEYYVASGAEKVYVAPGTRNPLVGMASESLFLGGLFEKLGVKLEYERIGKYKSAVESLAEHSMSDANREMSEAILDSLYQRFLEDVAKSRGLSVQQLSDAVDQGPASPAELEALHLIDGAAFLDEILEKQGKPPTISDETYAQVDPSAVGFKPKATFALIYGAGSVVVGEGHPAPGRGPVMASQNLADAFEKASEDPDVRAIVFRVDSPGGSALASDLIWRAIGKARAKGKPVIASLSDVAASGGYYVVSGADRIVAEPATLTGSIGVFVIRPMIAGALEKLDIGFASLTRGRNADLLLSTKPLSDAARVRMAAEVKGIYDQFVSRVAEGRHLEPGRVDEIGRGRVWTGAQAREIGLVDELGGLHDAVPFPPPKPLVEQLREALDGSVAARASSLVDAAIPRASRLALELVRELPAGVPILVPPVLAEVH
jgi:protease-4